MEVKNVKTDKIKMYERNVKKHPEDQVEQIANSIREFGFKQPLVIDKKNVLIIGHGRLMAAQQLGLEEVPCVLADDLSEDQIKALRIADNKLADISAWDNDALAAEIKEIGKSIDMTDFGFGDFELSILTEDFTPEAFDDDIDGYAENAENFTANKRVIITFKDEEEMLLRQMLHIPDGALKVIYRLSELME